MVKKLLGVCWFLLFANGVVSAQSLYNYKYYGPYVLLYKLNSEQVKVLISNPNKPDTAILFTNLVGKVRSDSTFPLKKKPHDIYPVQPFTDMISYSKNTSRFHIWDIKQFGYYLEVSGGTNNIINYRLIENAAFKAGAHKIGYESFVFVEDSSGLPVTDALVKLDTFTCRYDNGVGGYKIPGTKVYGQLKISKGNYFTYSQLQGYNDPTNNKKPPCDNYNYSKVMFQGYLVTNKPRYKPYDTIHFKSFLVNGSGKPLREKITAILSQEGNPYHQILELKPKVKGDYFNYFVITDSFYLDQPLTLMLTSKLGTFIKSQQVMLENYELHDLKFEIKTDKMLVTPGGGLKVYATATSANNLPVMDGKITLKMGFNTINFVDGDSICIPFAKHQLWYTVSVQTDPSGVTVFEIPDSVFMPLDASMYVQCYLLTADNEMREASIQFNYQTTRDRLEAALVADTLTVTRFYNMKSARRLMRTKWFTSSAMVYDASFETPLKAYIPPNIYMVQIFSGDTLMGTFYRQRQLPEITGMRTADSVKIMFKSAHDIPVFYRIYANNVLVESGRASQLNFQKRDASKNSYHLQYGILEGSVTNPSFYSKSFHLAEKELRVQIIQPETVYPGQEVPIEILVKNAAGKPVKKVNLAAWAVNTQLDGIVTPDVPYMGLVKPQKPLPLQNWPIILCQQSYAAYIKSWQLSAFGLYDNVFFKLMYAPHGFTILTDTTPQHSTELAFYAHSKNLRQSISYIKANDSLIWANRISQPRGGIQMKPGTYNFTIRTFDHLYQFKNVKIEAGKKTIIGLQIDSLNSLNLGDTISPGLLKGDELEMLLNHTLFYNFSPWATDTLMLRRNGKVVYGADYTGRTGNTQPLIKLNTPLYNPGKSARQQNNTQTFALYGPLNEGDTLNFEWKNGYIHQFIFKPKYLNGFTQYDHVTEFAPKWNYNLDAIRLMQQLEYSNYNFNEFWWDPEFKDTTKKTPLQPEEPYIEPTWTESLTPFQYKNYYYSGPTPGVYNSLLNLYFDQNLNPQKMWLFDLQDSLFSVLENNGVVNSSYPNIAKNSRRNQWLMAPKKKTQYFRLLLEINDSMWLVKNLKIDSSMYVYLTLDSKDIRKLGRNEHIFYDRLAKGLTREPLRDWVDTPTINKGLYVIPVKHKAGKTMIEGTVIGPNMKYTVDNAFVVLENNGKFIKGAITNAEGRFNMENLQPGMYMIKVRADNYNYWIHYQIEVKSGYNHILQIQMKQYAWTRYSEVVVSEDAATWANAPGEMYFNSSAAPSYSYSGAGSYTISSKDILKLPQRGLGSIVNISSGINSFGFESKKLQEVVIVESAFENQDGLEGESDPEFRADSVLVNTDNESQRLQTLAADQNAKRTRKDFKDYAYWVPNLYTNKAGKAGFTVRYPDNVTSWQTFVPAMDGKRHSGLGQLVVRSYKPISNSLALPAFLTEGDSLSAYGRVMNYTGKPQTGLYSLKYGNKSISQNVTITDFYNEVIQVIAGNPGDSMFVESGFEMPNGYRDAERRTILVNAATVLTGRSSFSEINNDTTLILKADTGTNGMDIAIYNQQLQMVLEIIAQIENQPAYDNLSLANYLNALLIKKNICTALKLPFNGEKQIRQTMSKLKKSQKDNGLFGWFKNSNSSYMVSTVVTEVMFKADHMGYSNNTWLNASRKILGFIGSTYGMERLQYLVCLKNINLKLNYDSMLRAVDFASLDKSGKLQYWRLQQMLGKNVPYNEINGMANVSFEGNLYIPGTWDWRCAPITDDAANTYKAWEILFNGNQHAERRTTMLQYLLMEAPNTSNSWIKATEGLVQEASKKGQLNANFSPEVTVNGVLLNNSKWPVTYHLKPGESITMKHKGAPVYVAANSTWYTYKPKSDSTQFAINVKVPTIKGNVFAAGEPVEMKVMVFAKRGQSNTVIEVPIPAGCVYGNKIQDENPYETYREYKSDRVLIFSDDLPFGYHTYTISLIPKFSGSFNTAPARAALLFYPDKAAFTPKAKWWVKK
jgi:hypothetical protein